MTQSTFEMAQGVPDFWALSDLQLARGCLRIAEGRSALAGAKVRAEAMTLFMVWQDALVQCPRGEAAEERAAILAAVRKRTIQVLVKMSMGGRGMRG